MKPRRVKALGTDCGSHAQARLAQMKLGYPRGSESVSWDNARPGDLVFYRQSHVGIVADPKRKIVESRWGIGGPAYLHDADATPYGPVVRIEPSWRQGQQAKVPQRGQRLGTDERTDRKTIKPIPWPPYPSDADDDYCPIHDEHYKQFKPGISYASVAASLPKAGQSKRAGYQKANHGDVLKLMGVLKTNAWRERHGWCSFDEPERPDYYDPAYAEPLPKPTSDLICFQAKGAPKCIIGRRRKNTHKGRPPMGGAKCRETLSGKYTDKCVPGRTVSTPKRRK